MRGHILQLNDEQRTGLILGSDGNRYGFAAPDWRGSVAPNVGGQVDYVTDGDKARDVFPFDFAPGNAMAPASAVAYSAPKTDGAMVLGGLGVLCLALNFYVPVLPLLPALVLGLIGAGSAKKSGNGNALVLSRIAWIGSVVLFALGFALIALGLSLFGWATGITFHDLMQGDWHELYNGLKV